MRILTLLVIVSISCVFSDNIAIFGTGLDASGNPAPGGSLEQHWTVANAIVYVGEQPLPGEYVPNTAQTQWIGFNPNLATDGGVGTHDFLISFDLSGLDPSSASLTLEVAADDAYSVSLNGIDTGASCASSCWFTRRTHVITSGFQNGLNSLDVTAFYEGGPGGLTVAASGTANPQTPSQFCASVDQSDWNYGQGYYCSNGGFIQCWGFTTDNAQTFGQYFDCPATTSCQCGAGIECSNQGTSSPCTSN